MTTEVFDRFAPARAVADAVLYEGYVLYPYRASSRKNQVRWQFGVLTPKRFSELDGSERWAMRTECLVAPGSSPRLTVRVRCLQVQHRTVEVLAGAAAADGESDQYREVESAQVDGDIYVAWDEAVDQVVDVATIRLSELDGQGHEKLFRFASGSDTEVIRRADGEPAGRLVRRREQIDGRVRVQTSRPDGGGPTVKVTVTVENATDWTGTSPRREAVMAHSLLAVHTMLAIDDGAFVSLLDPPEAARQAVTGCQSDGSFPVLIGGDQVMLSSPIILYDQPEVAPESPGDLYDSTEIDEILALRVMTLTDEEKAEARGTDPRAAAIIDRCDDMPPELWDRLHGAIRSVHPVGSVHPGAAPDAEVVEVDVVLPGEVPIDPVPWWDPAVDASVDPWTDSVTIAGVEVSKGSFVRLQPNRRSDAQDLFLIGLTATVAGVFQDVDGTAQVAVTIDDDPASVELVWQGRYLFFFPDEVEPLGDPEGAR